MYENENQSFDNREQDYHYTNTPEQQAPTRPRKKNTHAARIAKKAGAIALSAVLFGGVASGTFLGVNYAAGYRNNASTAASSESASASSQTASSSSSLLKATTPVSTGSAASSGSLDVSSVAESVMPSIVSITNKSVQEVQNYFSMFGYGGQAQEVESTSVGSGIIIGKNDTELLIVTNNHVVEGADTLSASFIDNSVYEATIKGTDSDNDLAVIAVPLSSISDDTMSQIAVAAVGDSDSLKVGEQVVAIGNALGYGQSVTTGIVSATDRTLSSSDSSDSNALISSTVTTKETPTYIQTDAANDAAVAVAELVGGSEQGFVQMMNDRAAELGMTNTTFHNACGLDTEGHLSTARDVAIMSRQILTTCPEVLHYTGIWTDTLRGPIRLDFFVYGKVADMLLEHHKREVRAVHKLFHAARRPVKERLSVNFDQRFRADKAVFKKPAAPAGHGENQVKFRHDVPLFKKPSSAGEGGTQRGDEGRPAAIACAIFRRRVAPFTLPSSVACGDSFLLMGKPFYFSSPASIRVSASMTLPSPVSISTCGCQP